MKLSKRKQTLAKEKVKGMFQKNHLRKQLDTIVYPQTNQTIVDLDHSIDLKLLSIDFNLLSIDFNLLSIYFELISNYFEFTFNWFQFTANLLSIDIP